MKEVYLVFTDLKRATFWGEKIKEYLLNNNYSFTHFRYSVSIEKQLTLRYIDRKEYVFRPLDLNHTKEFMTSMDKAFNDDFRKTMRLILKGVKKK